MPIDYIERSGSWRFHSSAIPRQAVNLQVFNDLFSTGDFIRLRCSTHGYDIYRGVQYSYARLLNYEADCDEDGRPITYLNLQLLVDADKLPNYTPLEPPSPHISYPRELVLTNLTFLHASEAMVKSELIVLRPSDVEMTQAGACVGASNLFLLRFGCTVSEAGEWGPLEPLVPSKSLVPSTTLVDGTTYATIVLKRMIMLNQAVQTCLSRCRINQNNTCSYSLSFSWRWRTF